MSYFVEKYFNNIEERLDAIEYFDKNVRDELNKLNAKLLFLEEELGKTTDLSEFKNKYMKYLQNKIN